MPEAAIFDYGAGNLLSLKVALEKVGLKAKIGSSAGQLRKADAVVLPGVGSFSASLEKLDAVKQELLDIVERGLPLLGICLGLQLFFQESEEGPGKGLSLFEGKSLKLPGSVKVPHMGWNTLRIMRGNRLLEGVDGDSYLYFVHSLYPIPLHESIVCAETNYGTKFASAIESENVFGTQFHPEKSGEIGLRILENFARIVTK
jgi:glutamine amidotransferase